MKEQIKMNDIIKSEPEVIPANPIPRNVSYARSLRMLADFYEQNSEMFVPEMIIKVYGTITKEDLAKCARALGSFKKEYSDDFIYLNKKFGDITLQVVEYREKSCVRVVVGTRKVIKEIPIVTKSVEVEEEIVEWKCRETSLLAKTEPTQIEGAL